MTRTYLLTLFFSLLVPTRLLLAGDTSATTGLSPVIALQTTTVDSRGARLSPSQAPFSTDQTSITNAFSADNYTNLNDQDIFSFTLGASFNFSDWLGVGATYALPIKEDDMSLDEKKYSIEAMVTMQF